MGDDLLDLGLGAILFLHGGKQVIPQSFAHRINDQIKGTATRYRVKPLTGDFIRLWRSTKVGEKAILAAEALLAAS